MSELFETRKKWCELNLKNWRKDPSGTWGGANCQHPNHSGGDKSPSFRVNLETGGCKCHGCKWTGTITIYAEECGLPNEGLPVLRKQESEEPPDKKGKLGKEVAWYPYYLADGSPYMRVVRFDPKDFRPQFWCKKVENYKFGNPGKLPLIPMNLPQIAKHSMGEPILWCEGEKDCINAKSQLGMLATTTPHGASSFGQVDLDSLEAFRGHMLVLIPDNDPGGRDYIGQVAKALYGIAALILTLTLPNLPQKGDLSDWLDMTPPAERKKAFNEMLESEHCVEYDPETSQMLNREKIRIGDRELVDVTNDAVKALQKWNKPPQLFHRSGSIVRIIHDPDGFHQVNEVEADSLLGYLSESARWVRYTKNGEVDLYPDRTVSKDIALRRPDILPPLVEICQSPVYDRNLRLIRKPGYDESTGIYLDCRDLNLPRTIPHADSDVRAARELIMDSMLGDFPFVDDSSAANCVATMLVPFVRRILGPTPLHIFESPSAGTGKGLLANLVSIPSTGRSPAIATGNKDSTEFKKSLTAKLSSLPIYVLIDEIQSCLYSDILASILTAEVWEDRILGKTKIVAIPNRACWLGAGNNLAIKRDIARRTVWIRLDRKVANPWSYNQFKISDIKTWCMNRRKELLMACLTLCQSWIARGCPEGTVTIGSFERYSRVIGGILNNAGIHGFLQNHEINVQRSDVVSEEWEEFVIAWYEEIGTRKTEITELSKLMESKALMGSLISNNTPAGRRVSLGKRIQGQVDRIWPCGLAIRIAVLKNEKGIRQYKLEQVHQTCKLDSAEDIQEAVMAAGKAVL